MTFRFGKASHDAMRSVHPDLVRVMGRALAFGLMDFSLSEGERSVEKQLHYHNIGRSQVKFGKHQIQTDGWAHAIHAVPYPSEINGVNVWDDHPRFARLAGMIQVAAWMEGVRVRWGGDWDGDGNNADSSLNDMAHWELVT